MTTERLEIRHTRTGIIGQATGGEKYDEREARIRAEQIKELSEKVINLIETYLYRFGILENGLEAKLTEDNDYLFLCRLKQVDSLSEEDLRTFIAEARARHDRVQEAKDSDIH